MYSLTFVNTIHSLRWYPSPYTHNYKYCIPQRLHRNPLINSSESYPTRFTAFDTVYKPSSPLRFTFLKWTFIKDVEATLPYEISSLLSESQVASSNERRSHIHITGRRRR